MRWLALGYNVPINPSKNRVYIWRKLKELGAEYFKQGVAVLPLNKFNYAQFKTLASKIISMGGEASIVELKFIDSQDELEMIAKFKHQYASELSKLKDDCTQIITDIGSGAGHLVSEYDAERVKKMVRKFNKSKQRNHFDSNLVEDIETALLSLSDILKQGKGEISTQLIKFLEKQL